MSVLDNKIKAKIVETKSIEASLTIQLILTMICKHWEKCLDNYYIMEAEPELKTDDYGDSVTINISDTSRIDIEGVVSDVSMLFEEELEEYIKQQEILATAVEEGEDGVL